LGETKNLKVKELQRETLK